METIGRQLIRDVMKGFNGGSIRMDDGSHRVCMTRNALELFLIVFLNKYEELKKNRIEGQDDVEKERITPDYLRKSGYEIDEKETELLREVWKHSPEYTEGINIESYSSKDGRITVKREWTNRYGKEGYTVHVDNRCYESVGWGEFLYVKDFENFIESVYDERKARE